MLSLVRDGGVAQTVRSRKGIGWAVDFAANNSKNSRARRTSPMSGCVARRFRQPEFPHRQRLMFGVGMILTGTLALLPSMMQVWLNYPVFDAGWMMALRGFGTMLAMFIVARMIDRVDNRLFILVGFLLTAASLWQM